MMKRWKAMMGLCSMLALACAPVLAAEGGGEAAKFHKPEEDTSLRFVPVEPNIVTNFQRKDGKKLGVIQVQIQLTTPTNAGVDELYEYLPLLRDKLIVSLSAMSEEQVKNLAERDKVRQNVTAELRKLLKEQGKDEKALQGILFTGFMYQ